MPVALRGVKPKSRQAQLVEAWEWNVEFFSRSKFIFRFNRIIFHFPVSEIVGRIFKEKIKKFLPEQQK